MTIPLPYADQYACRNETLEVYASDCRGIVNYQFNNLGYRNNIDYNIQDTGVGVYIGSSITAGIGVDWNKSFVYLSSQDLQSKAYHFAQGCQAVDNNEILRMLQGVIHSGLDARYFVLQFIDLDREYDFTTGVTTRCQDPEQNVKRFQQVFDSVCDLLSDQHWCFIGCDRLQHQLPSYILQHKNLVSWNSPYIDFAGVGLHPGIKWHKMISLGVSKYLKTNI